MELYMFIATAQTSNGTLGQLTYIAWPMFVAGIMTVCLESEKYWPTKTAPCSGDILCERVGVRHRIECPGSTIEISKYVKGIKTA